MGSKFVEEVGEFRVPTLSLKIIEDLHLRQVERFQSAKNDAKLSKHCIIFAKTDSIAENFHVMKYDYY